MATVRQDSKNFSTQESVHPSMGVYVYGGTTLTDPPRAIMSNTKRNYTLTFFNGTSAILLLNAGQVYNFCVKTVATSGASAISSASKLVFYFM